MSEAAARVEAQKVAVSNAYSNVESQWQALEQQENDAHDVVDTREILRIQQEKARLQSEASQLQGGWQALLNEEKNIQTHANLTYDGLLESSSEASKMFLRAHAEKLGDPASLRRLTYADSRVKASGIAPDSKNYFAALEEMMGFTPEDRKTDFLDSPSKTKPRRQKDHKLTATEIELSRDLGLDPADYAKAAQQVYGFDPKADDSAQYLDPNDFVDTGKEPEMIIKFDEPKVEKRRYKVDPASKTAVHLSPAELEICRDAGISPSDYARNKIDIREGRTNHQLYVDNKVSARKSRFLVNWVEFGHVSSTVSSNDSRRSRRPRGGSV